MMQRSSATSSTKLLSPKWWPTDCTAGASLAERSTWKKSRGEGEKES